MSIASAIQAAQQKVADAYDACDDKGATMPSTANKNLSHLADTISSIPTGSPFNQTIQKEMSATTTTVVLDNSTAQESNYTILGVQGSNSGYTMYRGYIYIEVENVTAVHITFTTPSSNTPRFGVLAYDKLPEPGMPMDAYTYSYSEVYQTNVTRTVNLTAAQMYGMRYIGFVFAWNSTPPIIPSFEDIVELVTFSMTVTEFTTTERAEDNVGAVTAISANKFQDDVSLVSALIPDTVTTIGDNAFYRADNLRYINLKNVVSIGTNAFAYTALSYVPLQQVTTLGSTAFYGATRLEIDLDLPNFSGATIGSVFSHSGIKSIKNLGSATSIDNNAFSTCLNLVDLVIPSTITALGTYSFQKCYNLKTVVIPSGITIIPNYCFNSCVSLEVVDLASSVTTIDNNAFQVCWSLTEIDLSHVTTIGYSAFSGSGISGVIDLSSVTYIAYSAFQNCKNITEISGVGTNCQFQDNNSGNFAGSFENCTSLVTADIANATTIAGRAFKGCSALTNVVLTNVITIQKEAFSGSGITSLTLPNIHSIGNSVFSGCPIASLSLGSTLESIGTSNFTNIQFSSVEIGANCTSIGSYAFRNETQGAPPSISITIHATTPPTLGSQVFYYKYYSTTYRINPNVRIYVPASSLSAYRSASNWSEYASYISAIS